MDLSSASNEQLIHHLIENYHRPLLEELRRLAGLATKVARVHFEKDPERLVGVAETVTALMHDLEHHLAEEEAVIFPWILTGGVDANGRLKAVAHDHRSTTWALEELRRFTRDYTLPAEGACNSWRALWSGLQALELNLKEHMRIEDELLFPRVLGDGPPTR